MNEEQKRLDLNKLKELRLGPFAQYLPVSLPPFLSPFPLNIFHILQIETK